MPPHRNHELELRLESLLKSPVRTRDDLAKLFCSLLGFEYVGRPFSSRDKETWGEGDAARIAADQNFSILARHGDIASGGFAVIYGELRPFSRAPQRTLILQLRKRFPAALFLFADAASLGAERGARVHIVHAKVSGPASGDEASQRLVLRRFRIGPGERYRTAAERLAKLDLSGRSGIGTLELGRICDEAFDKEALTNEFFKKLDGHIRALEADLRANHQGEFNEAEAFTQAQLLLERLVFLYFAQNRGWLNQEADYLIKHFAKHKQDLGGFGYYQEFLHRLFRSLAEPSFGDRLEGIPFLNGGLFDDDEFRPPQSKLRISNETFAALFTDLLEAYNFTVREDTPLSQEVAVDPEMLGKIFESIVLHAESAGEEFQAPDKRKATGSYYTPRIVVHFICREALRLYFVNRAPQLADPSPEPRSSRGNEALTPVTHHASRITENQSLVTSAATWSQRISRLFKEIEPDDGFNESELKILREILTPTEAKRCLETLNQLRTLDPAVGSGAFPVGLLHELVSLRRVFECVANGYQDPVKGEGDTWKQKAKEHFIQNSLFGVDIQQQAIEICRLRLWLSLLVDYELGVNPFEAERSKFIEAIGHISQLPNLEMNFRRGDSLHDYICGHPVRLDGTQLKDYSDDLALIEKKGEQLHHAKRGDTKKKLRLEILSHRLDLGQRVVKDQIHALSTNQQVGDLFGVGASDAANQRRVDAEIARLRDALKQLESDGRELAKLQKLKSLNLTDFYRHLRELEGSKPGGPHNFVWRLDFPHVLAMRDKGTVLDSLSLVNEAGQGELVAIKSRAAGGFDLIVGNPPFVTARNAEKRELYAKRWPRVCYKNYLLVCPFFELSFGLLKPAGQLGFIVANAFAQRDLGQPLVENFFPTVDLQKVVDCSGLMFPGHGTPTCLVFGAQRKPAEQSPVRVAAILPGGGDLRTSPEESPLWYTLAAQHDNPGFSDSRVVVADRPRNEMGKWPWNFGGRKSAALGQDSSLCLESVCAEPIGAQFITGKDEAYVLTDHCLRRLGIPADLTRAYGTGEDVRNWTALPREFIVFPYDSRLAPLSEPLPPPLARHLKPFRETLENCVISGSIKKKETHLKWFEFRRLARAKFEVPLNIINPHIATHCHFLVCGHEIAFKEKALAIALRSEFHEEHLHLLCGWLNSSLLLETVKRDCFSKRESEDAARDTYYEFAGEKLRALVVPVWLNSALSRKPNPLTEGLTALSRACWERGCELPSLALRKLFERSSEAYHAWNAALPGHVAPHAKLGAPFTTTAELQDRFARAVSQREQLRAEMIALQEEMDWLVYAAYGLLDCGGKRSATPLSAGAEPLSAASQSAVTADVLPAHSILPLQESERPFRLWAAGGDYRPRRETHSRRLAAVTPRVMGIASRRHPRQRAHPPHRAAGL